ncbi:putative pyruvate kinase [Helianthus annuus]|nr:putative pyruvate kinase [Helianthus annuus]
MGEIFGYHAATIANTLNTPIIVFTRTGSMAVILSHYRLFSAIFSFTNAKRVQKRLMLYHGVMPIYMEFSDDAEESFSRALNIIVDKSLVKEGQYVTFVQSGAQPI